MKQDGLNLEHMVPMRDGELRYPLYEPVSQSIFGRDVNILNSPSIQELVGQPGALSQDAFSALIVRQGGFKGTV